MKSRTLYVAAAFPLLLSAAGCTLTKTESPLSPTVAGPIPGVTITAPNPVTPRDGVRIPNDTQPVTLVLLNASTTSVRPLSYAIDVATDGAFASIVVSRSGIAPGTGQTSVRLDALAPNRTYYWRAKAQDGANEGPYSAAATFDVVTGAAFGAPVPVSPINGTTASSTTPTFVWQNAPRTGTPAGTVVYEIQASEAPDFVIALGAVANEQAGSTTQITSPAAAPNSRTYYWRVRATDAASAGPWSATASFVTPAASSGGGGGGGNAGGGGPANQNCHIGAGPATVDRAGQAVYGCGDEFPQLLGVFGSEDEAVAAAEQLLLRTIWHLKLAGFDVARQRNPSGLISKDKFNIRIDGVYHVYDIYALGFAGQATRITGMNDVCPDLLCSSPIPENGIPD
jgi:hypothetical protein